MNKTVVITLRVSVTMTIMLQSLTNKMVKDGAEVVHFRTRKVEDVDLTTLSFILGINSFYFASSSDSNSMSNV